jgi:hypothetical protein
MRRLLVGLLILSSCKDDAAKDKAPKEPKKYCSLIPYNQSHATKGLLDVRAAGNDVEISGAIKGLNPGSYSIHLHRSPGCPRPAQREDNENHDAELGVITADAGGIAPLKLTVPNARLATNDKITEHPCLLVYQTDLSGYVASCRVHIEQAPR